MSITEWWLIWTYGFGVGGILTVCVVCLALLIKGYTMEDQMASVADTPGKSGQKSLAIWTDILFSLAGVTMVLVGVLADRTAWVLAGATFIALAEWHEHCRGIK